MSATNGTAGSNQAAAAAAIVAALPPLDRMSLIAIWIETLLYGINIVVYFGALYVLVFKPNQGSKIHLYLLGASTLLFLISTAHVAVSLRQLIEALTNKAITSVPGGSALYFLNQADILVFSSQVLYTFNVLIQDVVLIWRLYAVYGYDWRVPILPLLLEAIHTSSALYTVTTYYHGATLENTQIRRWGLTSWSLDIVINIVVTGLIAGKIWYQGRHTVATRGYNAYIGVAYTMLESGGLFTGATLILFALYINASTGFDALVGVNVVTQLAMLSPLLIVTRVGLGLTHGNFSTRATQQPSTQFGTGYFGTESNAVRVDIHQTQEMDADYMREGSFAMRAVKADM